MGHVQPYWNIRLSAAAKRPSVRFRRWVEEYGVSRLAHSLSAHRTTVQRWLTETHRFHSPKLRVHEICALSEKEPNNFGPLSYADVLGQVRVEWCELTTTKGVEDVNEYTLPA